MEDSDDEDEAAEFDEASEEVGFKNAVYVAERHGIRN